MTIAEASSVLGIPRDVSLEQARAAFRRLVQASHPDHSGADDATARTARVVIVYQTWRRRPSPLTAGPRASDARTPPPPRPTVVGTPRPGAEPGSAVVLLPLDTDPFYAVLTAGERLGVVTYASRADGIVETLLRENGETCSLLFRLDDEGAVIVSIDALANHELLDATPYAARVATLLADLTP